MKVELTIARTDGEVGDIIDVSQAEAERLFEGGVAIPVRAPKKERAAKKMKVEKAVK